jgi:membrane protease YdiL (CAAX protease family)
MPPSTLPTDPRRLDRLTWATLVVTLVVYPAVYSSGIMSALVRPIIVDHSRPHWWSFHAALMLFHWLPFGLVWLVLRHRGETWSSVGVDWSWFRRLRWILAAVVAFLAVAAVVMPRIHYGDDLPGISRTIFLAPVSTPERLWMIWVAVTAAVTEEVLFRGFALTRLTRALRSPWLALPLTVVAFVFIHGVPRDVEALVAYVAAGLAFGIPFILMGLKRLEIVVAIHFAIDASMVLAP